MRAVWLTLILALPMSACGQVSDVETQSVPIPETESVKTLPEDVSEWTDEQTEIYNLIQGDDDKTNGTRTPQIQMGCNGVIQQGGAVLCQTTPNQKVKIGRTADDFYYESADENGQILIGFDRDETRALIDLGLGETFKYDYRFETREYDVSHVSGLPPSQAGNYNAEQLAHIRASSARKKQGFASRATAMGFENGFIYPVENYRKTTNFGAYRTYNGNPGSPHMGVDMAAPTGTPIYAPADGVVSMADNDLYFEGAMVLLDHGQGLISMYLHVSEILVEPGQEVKQGDVIAKIGSRGRSTGPHLCWRLKWRNRSLDPELLTQWPTE